jgi:hypothetical protein
MGLETAGQFWVPDNTDVTARGDFTAHVGEQPEVRLHSGLVDDPQIRAFAGGSAFSGSAADSVAAFLPITLHGQLDTGDILTMLDAQNYGYNPPFGAPRYVAHNVVFGGHVSGVDEPYSAIRFRLGHPYWLAHLQEGEPVIVEDDESTLSVEAADDGNWLVYSSSTPATLRQLEIRVVSGCLVLLQLVLDQTDISTHETQVRLDGDRPWLPVYVQRGSRPLLGVAGLGTVRSPRRASSCAVHSAGRVDTPAISRRSGWRSIRPWTTRVATLWRRGGHLDELDLQTLRTDRRRSTFIPSQRRQLEISPSSASLSNRREVSVPSCAAFQLTGGV